MPETLRERYKATVINSNRDTISLEATPDGLVVRAPEGISDEQIEGFLRAHTKWIERNLAKVSRQKDVIEDAGELTKKEIAEYTAKAYDVIPERVNYYCEKLGVKYNKLTIRHQRSRWGSCTSNGNLSFNCLLMLTPPEVLDSVIVHEVCHLKELNHSRKFYYEVRLLHPSYQQQREWLRENGQSILLRIPKA